jgi:murein DD-endopeptidase MepM/ murein hydrolase activator NlpD
MPMIAVLRRQFVQRRTPRARRIRSSESTIQRTVTGAPRVRQPILRRVPSRTPSPRLLEGQKPARARRLLRPKGIAATRVMRKALRNVPRFLASVVARPWLTLVIAAALLTLIFVPALAMRGDPLPKAFMPAAADAEQALYRIIVPEEMQAAVSAGANPALLKSLKVSSYTVQQGETLSQIAKRLRLNIDTLISFNDIKDARSLSHGKVLEIPNSDGLKYGVRRGDTLEGISRSFSVPMESILDFNSLTTSVIKPGQEVFVPGARMSPAEINKVLGNLFIFPVMGDISSRFGERGDPFTGVERFHNGIDIANKTDTPVAAAMAGRVEATGYNGNYGRFIIIKHIGTSFQTLYAHLNKVLVSRGENVRQGQEIGELGNTGYSTGPHLHFSIFKNNEPVDPLGYLK